MAFRGWPVEALEFFEGLEADNSKAYWQAEQGPYESSVRGPMEELLAELAPECGEGRIFRPYRDVRFSADKTPYKTNIAATIGARYVRLSADALSAGCGHVGDGAGATRSATGRRSTTIAPGSELDRDRATTRAPRGWTSRATACSRPPRAAIRRTTADRAAALQGDRLLARVAGRRLARNHASEGPGGRVVPRIGAAHRMAAHQRLMRIVSLPRARRAARSASADGGAPGSGVAVGRDRPSPRHGTTRRSIPCRCCWSKTTSVLSALDILSKPDHACIRDLRRERHQRARDRRASPRRRSRHDARPCRARAHAGDGRRPRHLHLRHATRERFYEGAGWEHLPGDGADRGHAQTSHSRATGSTK